MDKEIVCVKIFKTLFENGDEKRKSRVERSFFEEKQVLPLNLAHENVIKYVWAGEENLVMHNEV